MFGELAQRDQLCTRNSRDLIFVGFANIDQCELISAILFALYSGRSAKDILGTDAIAIFDQLGLREHLTPQRSNGLRSMVNRIRSDAHAALAPVT